MTLLTIAAAGLLLWHGQAGAAEIDIPYARFQAPVVHAGRYHVLTCGGTCLVLDSERGYSIASVASGNFGERAMDDADTVLNDLRLTAVLDGAGTIDQALDRDARLVIIDQCADRVAARVECALRDNAGEAVAHGSIDLFLTRNGVHIIPRIRFDAASAPVVLSAGFDADAAGRAAGIIVDGALLMPDTAGRHIPFPDSTAFAAMITSPGRAAVKIGWSDPVAAYPDSGSDITTIAAEDPPGWRRSPSAGFLARYDGRGLTGVRMCWTSGDPLTALPGESLMLVGSMALYMGADTVEAQRRWRRHADPLEPVPPDGVSCTYNRLEGIYDIAAVADSLDIVFDNIDGDMDLDLAVRIPAPGGDAVVATLNGRPVPPALFTGASADSASSERLGDGSAMQYAVIGVPVQQGGRAQLIVTRREGLRFIYRTMSADETMELRSPYDGGRSLFRFSPMNGVLAGLRRPGGGDSVVGGISLGWTELDSGIGMTGVRGFRVEENSPGRLRFTWEAVADSGIGLSSATVTVALKEAVLPLEITTGFMPHGGGHGWRTLEYASMTVVSGDGKAAAQPVSAGDAPWPGEPVRPGETELTPAPVVAGTPASFAWLDSTGTFRSWTRVADGMPDTGGGMGEFPGTVGGIRSGLFWMAGFSPEGGVLFHMGDHTDSPGAYPGFTVAPNLVSVGNFIAGRADSSATETVSYTLTLCNGPLPAGDDLARMYRETAPEGGAHSIDSVIFSPDGRITGFIIRED